MPPNSNQWNLEVMDLSRQYYVESNSRSIVDNGERIETERQREYGRQEIKRENYNNNGVDMSRVKSESTCSNRREIYLQEKRTGYLKEIERT